MLRVFVVLLYIASLSLGCNGEGGTEAEGAPLSIVWITIDTIRADHLGAYGYFRETSPRFDALAEESILFERALAPIATTLPSHLSALTATYPNEHGVLANIKSGGEIFFPSDKLMSFAEFLGARGYATAAFVSATPLKDWSGIQRGFADYKAPETPTRAGDKTTDSAILWLAQHADVPFFLWVHLFDPHAPHEPPEGFELFANAPALESYLAENRFPDSSTTERGVLEITREAVNAYDAEILFVDRQIGRLVDVLHDLGLFDAAAIVIMGDHGEGMGQHDRPRHGHVWGEQLHVPLLIHVPGEPARRVSRLISIVDVFPTLLGMIDVRDEALYLANASGVDVLSAGEEPRAILSQTSMRLEKFGVPLRYSLTSDEWKYVSDVDGERGLYDLRVDPLELEDVADSRPEEVARLQVLLDERIAQQKIRRGLTGEKGVGEIDESTLEDLRSLGYVED